MSMEIRLATRPNPGRPNEDAAVTGDGFAVVLDGATAEPDTDPGCHHEVRWFATELAGRLGHLLAAADSASAPLTEILYDACAGVAASHSGTCDLTNPCSPSATVAIVRENSGGADYLVLGDAVVVFRAPGGRIRVVSDDRILAYDDWPWSRLREVRNVPGGFWVAGARPEAAHHAVVGSVPEVDVAALLSDGAARLVERYGWDWPALLGTLERHGPAEVIAETRKAELDTPPGRFHGKHHDDATAVLMRRDGAPAPAGPERPAQER
ncbi:protein phosphatase 2C domain-containing protein [Sinosporangium siamense]|uniref:PPM-type phosphatase domain-containing protein n=1 Tax=Sinosporangium siamense TaxID=1367973 RepID=A0A919V854_9ACTN|nr:protein phosphatase 2C domain-containing protein [Sinosporangium siamense]GII92837.1 hypothetical protein Ssi02_30680 [Sinosporangium siamense]